jgi:hypothetical protein
MMTATALSFLANVVGLTAIVSALLLLDRDSGGGFPSRRRLGGLSILAAGGLLLGVGKYKLMGQLTAPALRAEALAQSQLLMQQPPETLRIRLIGSDPFHVRAGSCRLQLRLVTRDKMELVSEIRGQELKATSDVKTYTLEWSALCKGAADEEGPAVAARLGQIGNFGQLDRLELEIIERAGDSVPMPRSIAVGLNDQSLNLFWGDAGRRFRHEGAWVSPYRDSRSPADRLKDATSGMLAPPGDQIGLPQAGGLALGTLLLAAGTALLVWSPTRDEPRALADGESRPADQTPVLSAPARPSVIGLAIPGLLMLTILVSKASCLELPLYWDEIAYAGPAHWLSEGPLYRALPGCHPPGTFFGHPPLLYCLLAAQYKLFGDTLWMPHLIALAFATIAVWFTYCLGSYLCNPATGALAAALLFFSPLYYAQSAMVLGDVPVAALGVMAVYYAFRRRFLLYVLAGVCLVLIKETAIAIIAALVPYFLADRLALYLSWKRTRPESDSRQSQVPHLCPPPGATVALSRPEGTAPFHWHALLRYAIPFIPICLFFVAERVTTGKFVTNPYFDPSKPLLNFDPLSPHVIERSRPHIKAVGRTIFLNQERWLLSALIFLALVIHGKSVWKKEFMPFLLIIAFFWTAFSLIFFMDRYIIPVLPYFCIIAAWAINVLVKGSLPKQFVLGLLIVLAFLPAHQTYTSSSFDETTMRYADVVVVHYRACRYVEENYGEKTVLAPYPLTAQLSNPYMGYVDAPIRVVKMPEDQCDVMLYTPGGFWNDHTPASEDWFKTRAQEGGFVVKQIFQRGNKYVTVYVRQTDH